MIEHQKGNAAGQSFSLVLLRGPPRCEASEFGVEIARTTFGITHCGRGSAFAKYGVVAAPRGSQTTPLQLDLNKTIPIPELIQSYSEHEYTSF